MIKIVFAKTVLKWIVLHCPSYLKDPAAFHGIPFYTYLAFVVVLTYTRVDWEIGLVSRKRHRVYCDKEKVSVSPITESFSSARKSSMSNNMRQKDIRPAPARIEFKGMKFLITDRPSDHTIQAYIMVSHHSLFWYKRPQSFGKKKNRAEKLVLGSNPCPFADQ